MKTNVTVTQNVKVEILGERDQIVEKSSTQSVFIEKEEDGTEWAILSHSDQEISLSLENLKKLHNLIAEAIGRFEI